MTIVHLDCTRRGGGLTETLSLDVDLLRRQRDWLLAVDRGIGDQPEAEGIINLLDALLDVAEGYPLSSGCDFGEPKG